MKTDTDNHAEEQAASQLEGILDLLERARSFDPEVSAQAYDEIYEDPLSVQVRSHWASPGEELTPGEFLILLCTGGPAVRVFGQIEDGEVISAELQYQDWFTPWERFPIPGKAEEDALLEYASILIPGY